ncbi:MAG: hypothetical protein WBB19_09305 [Desulforhopalus sp.]
MKKIIAVSFLLTCGLIMLLATVDLEPYLAPPDQPVIQEAVSLSPSLSSVPTVPSLPPVPALVETDEESPITQEDNEQTELPPTETAMTEQTFAQSGEEKLGVLFETMQSAAIPDAPPAERVQPTSPSKADSTTDVNETIEVADTEHIPSSLIELEVTILPVDAYPFSILLETFVEKASAEKAIRYYQERGIDAHWVKVALGQQGIRYRLFTGIFSSVPQAQQYLDQNQLTDKLIKPTYYSARVGVYQDKTLLLNAFVKTRGTGVIPYILGTQEGDYHLYVGAFYTFTGATTQCRDLNDAGLHCEPVRRSTIPPQ